MTYSLVCTDNPYNFSTTQRARVKYLRKGHFFILIKYSTLMVQAYDHNDIDLSYDLIFGI